MITNLAYLRTALELLEQGSQSAETEIRVLRTMQHICEQNIERLQMAQLDKEQ
jgi:hypothetical protein